MVTRSMSEPKTISIGRAGSSDSTECASYSQADAAVRKCVASADKTARLSLHVVVVFDDLFVWRTSLSVSGADATGENFVQRAIQGDWEFNAGMRPRWWPALPEAERIWREHFCEDLHKSDRSELARMRLLRYDLVPVVLGAVPARNAPPPPP
jgi:hypothetical protein